jgi:hypothetical protein
VSGSNVTLSMIAYVPMPAFLAMTESGGLIGERRRRISREEQASFEPPKAATHDSWIIPASSRQPWDDAFERPGILEFQKVVTSIPR